MQFSAPFASPTVNGTSFEVSSAVIWGELMALIVGAAFVCPGGKVATGGVPTGVVSTGAV